ncbi:helicase-exonuclease AddAB subunit AddA [Butyrivibrio sp. VCD2006]|uniref:helicase-exonuclease AddAB subunit AddA n=1 Tax=Butyrivibrio sp. VCD2006 TaxID=1280664 RepID=UPI000407C60B|nr:helicase-exonuclease AddAB subunit AddA [Butyrivibrio sp. VCD2006]
MGFTKEQQSVIDARKSNVLVSAAAGSGKTTVLVERIIQRITGDNPIDIDKLLVVTFTRAAAAQMKEKILKAIQAKLVEDPTNAHLQRQETLVHGAQITTIDSFCQYIIRNNFNDIDLDPSYRVADEGEIKLLQGDVLAELLEDKYAEGDPDFLNCMEYFATGSTDKKVEEFILKLYNYAMSMADPEGWLRERADDYAITEETFDAAGFVKDAIEIFKNDISEAKTYYEMALKLAENPDGPYFYSELFEKELEQVEKICNTNFTDFNDVRAAVVDFQFDTLPRKKDDSVNADKRGRAKDCRDKAKKAIKDLASKYFSEDKATICKRMELARKPVATFSELVISFKERFDAKKREKGIIDFSDMEHLALQIIKNGGAEQYRDYFEEVMIDEYQDSNGIQEELLSAVSGVSIGKNNRFMVGDVKQSIYKFRLARPEIFMEKMKTYEWEEGTPSRKISLHNNFRSRKDVLYSVNYIFDQIMGEELGGVSYNKDARLTTIREFPEAEDKRAFSTEYMFADIGKAASEDAREMEAKMIATRIHEAMESGIVTGEDGKLRKVRYGDIVILLRTAKGWDDVFKKTLESRGIPTYIESRTGYFSATEVVTVLNFLRILNNPRQDVPLVSVMHSAIGGFTDEDLALIKAHDRDVEKSKFDSGSFYDILLRCITPKDEEADQNMDAASGQSDAVESSGKTDKKIFDVEKIERFIALIDEYRTKAEYMPVNELIRDILNETHYSEYCAALPGGTKRLANLKILVEKATAYEQTSFSGVFHFVKYIEELEKFEVDYGEANTLDENADVVRIMSIHKSKGLEFPIVFLAGMSKTFNFMDTRESVVLDVDMGIGTNVIDLENRIKYNTLRKSVMSETMKMSILGEEMRILYVAMTRAKDKLIMTGQGKIDMDGIPAESDFAGKLQNFLFFRDRPAIEGEQPYLLPYYLRSSATTYQDLVLMALARHDDFKKLGELIGLEIKDKKGGNTDVPDEEAISFDFRIMTDNELEAEEIGNEVTARVRLDNLTSTSGDEEKEYVDLFAKRFEDTYAFTSFDRLFVKTTVTELKKAKLEQKEEPSAHLYEEEEIVPSFIETKEKKAEGAARGTIYHRVMELLYDEDSTMPQKNATNSGKSTEILNNNVTMHDFASMSPDDRAANLASWMKEMEDIGKMPEGSSESVDEADILKFYNSDTGKRMKTAHDTGRLHRESPFMMGIKANKVNSEFPESERVLIQGIIDVWFEEDDGLVLLDYKTDKVRKGSELVDRYSVQLDYYQEALERITHKKVKERIIYSFTLGETINL